MMKWIASLFQNEWHIRKLAVYLNILWNTYLQTLYNAVSGWGWSVAPCHGCWWTLPVLQQLDSGAVQNHCSLKSSHWSRRMCCLHCCACYHSTQKSMGEFDKESLCGKCALQLALLQCGNCCSELFTPSFPGISMVWGHGLSLALLWYASDCPLLCSCLGSSVPSNFTSTQIQIQENETERSLSVLSSVSLPSSKFLGAISSTDIILWQLWAIVLV